jgi:protein-S-isoprenylcysteine O-methyltransferase Ste14
MNSNLKAGIARRVVQVLFVIVFQAAVLFVAAGRLDWLWAWVFLGLNLVGILANAVLLRHQPEMIAERGRGGENWKDWDKVIGGLWGLVYFVLLLLVAGLDERLGWTGPVSLAVHLSGAIAFALGFALFSWAMSANAYFSTIVRIQAERGHAVCDRGPYRLVRHPGYVGAILQSLATPLLLGSLWALISGGLAALLMILRTALEDRTLREELPGYAGYAQRTRYRLVPGIW